MIVGVFHLLQETWIGESWLLYQNVEMEFKTVHACEIAHIIFIDICMLSREGNAEKIKSWVIMHGKSSIWNHFHLIPYVLWCKNRALLKDWWTYWIVTIPWYSMDTVLS